jgi:hypothetical protein
MWRLWHDIRTHRLAVVLYGLYWLVTMLITVASHIYPMPDNIFITHLIAVIAAAALVAWWRDADEQAVPVCMGVGALIGAVEVWVIMLAGDLACWLAYCSPVSVPADEEPAWVFLLLITIIASVIGCLLGWLVALISMPLARWLRGRGGPTAPLSGA